MPLFAIMNTIPSATFIRPSFFLVFSRCLLLELFYPYKLCWSHYRKHRLGTGNPLPVGSSLNCVVNHRICTSLFFISILPTHFYPGHQVAWIDKGLQKFSSIRTLRDLSSLTVLWVERENIACSCPAKQRRWSHQASTLLQPWQWALRMGAKDACHPAVIQTAAAPDRAAWETPEEKRDAGSRWLRYTAKKWFQWVQTVVSSPT